MAGTRFLLHHGNYDVIEISLIDEKNNQLYFMASPENATQSYLYKMPWTGMGKLSGLLPRMNPGTQL